MNYFNYFTEIEDTFIRRRGKHLLLSPMDWALIESWKEMGVPLHVALRGIERAFDSHDAKPRRRSVKTLLYCQEEVEAQFAEWREAQLGSGKEHTNGDGSAGQRVDEDVHLPFPRAIILEHLARARAALMQICSRRRKVRADQLSDAFSRAARRLKGLEEDFGSSARPDAEKLEESLAGLEKLLDDALRAGLSPADLAAARSEAETQLHPFRNRMERATYEQTLDNLVLKRLRDHYGVPRLSLFYL